MIMEEKQEFREINKRSKDFLIDLPLKFDRHKSPCGKYIITTLTYGKALYRTVIQEVSIERRSEDIITYTNSDTAWSSPIYITKVEAIDSALTFIKEHLS